MKDYCTAGWMIWPCPKSEAYQHGDSSGLHLTFPLWHLTEVRFLKHVNIIKNTVFIKIIPSQNLRKCKHKCELVSQLTPWILNATTSWRRCWQDIGSGRHQTLLGTFPVLIAFTWPDSRVRLPLQLIPALCPVCVLSSGCWQSVFRPHIHSVRVVVSLLRF